MSYALNFNTKVSLKLTQDGRNVLARHVESEIAKLAKAGMALEVIRKFKDNYRTAIAGEWVQWSLFTVCEIFGPNVYVGCEYFIGSTVIIEEDKLEDEEDFYHRTQVQALSVGK